MQICNNKLSEHNIPKDYLSNKNFSYKIYINLCYISFWSYFQDTIDSQKRIEYKLGHYNLTTLETLIGLSKNTIRNKLNNTPYRVKSDYFEVDSNGEVLKEYTNIRTKYLFFNSPTKNYLKLSLKEVEIIKSLSEIEIRLFIFIKSFSSDEIIGQTQKKILESIGYSSKSKSNEKLLRDATHKLKELGLIETKMYSDGIKKYIIYYKK